MAKCISFSLLNGFSLIYNQLKSSHTAINIWWAKSGVHWDNENGCCIVSEMEAVWEAHMAVGVSQNNSQVILLLIIASASQTNISGLSRLVAGSSSP